MVEITGTPIIDWLLTQAPVTVVLGIAAWRLERIVASVLAHCQAQVDSLTAFVMEQVRHEDED